MTMLNASLRGGTTKQSVEGNTPASGWISFPFLRAGPEFSSGEGVPIYWDGRVKDNHLPLRCAWVLLPSKAGQALEKDNHLPPILGSLPRSLGVLLLEKEEKALRAAGVNEQKQITDNR